MNKLTTEDYTQLACIALNLIAIIIFLIVFFPIAAVVIIYSMGKAARES